MQHNPNDKLVGEAKHQAFIAEFHFITILRQLAYCKGKPANPNNAYNFVIYLSYTYQLPPVQQENLRQLAISLYRFIDVTRFFNMKELIIGLKAIGYRNIDITKILHMRNRSMVNYYLDTTEERDLRTHLVCWGQLDDINTFLTCYKQFQEALHGQNY